VKWIVGACTHETNTFSTVKTDLDAFRAQTYVSGNDLLSTYRGTGTVVGGFIEALGESDDEIVASVAGEATPSGLGTRDAYDAISNQILATVGANPDADGILLALHGAMAAEGIDDVEGDLLRRVREVAGMHVPIVAVLDLHANVSREMVEAATALVGYRKYPHTDMRERGIEAARLIRRVARGDVKPVPGLTKPAMIPVCGTCHTQGGLYKELWEEALRTERPECILTTSLFAGFPYADVPFMGFAVLVYADDDGTTARVEANRLTDQLWERRHEFTYIPTSVPDAVSAALAVRGSPVVIADIADNPGGGAASDSVEILRELIRREVRSAAVATIHDPDVVHQAETAGLGGRLTVTLGAKTDALHGAPIQLDVSVRSLFDGKFEYKGPMNRGAWGNLGPSAVLEANGIQIIVNSAQVQPWDPEVFRAAGIEPLDIDILVLKSAVHFRAAFEPISAAVILADGPGLTSLELTRFAYKHIRRPIFPLDEL